MSPSHPATTTIGLNHPRQSLQPLHLQPPQMSSPLSPPNQHLPPLMPFYCHCKTPCCKAPIRTNNPTMSRPVWDVTYIGSTTSRHAYPLPLPLSMQFVIIINIALLLHHQNPPPPNNISLAMKPTFLFSSSPCPQNVEAFVYFSSNFTSLGF